LRGYELGSRGIESRVESSELARKELGGAKNIVKVQATANGETIKMSVAHYSSVLVISSVWHLMSQFSILDI
jgi:hypothetical protein